MNTEKIILEKRYFELSKSELESIKTLVSNENEFDDLKVFLQQTKGFVKANKISTSNQLDKLIFNKINSTSNISKPIWYNSFLLFLFPRDKQFYKYPAFQLALASVLIFGVFNIINFSADLSTSKSELALNTIEDQIEKEVSKINDSSETISFIETTEQNTKIIELKEFDDISSPGIVDEDLLEFEEMSMEENVTLDFSIDNFNYEVAEELEVSSDVTYFDDVEKDNKVVTSDKLFKEKVTIQLSDKKSSKNKAERAKPQVAKNESKFSSIDAESIDFREDKKNITNYSVKEVIELNDLFFVVLN